MAAAAALFLLAFAYYWFGPRRGRFILGRSKSKDIESRLSSIKFTKNTAYRDRIGLENDNYSRPFNRDRDMTVISTNSSVTYPSNRSEPRILNLSQPDRDGTPISQQKTIRRDSGDYMKLDFSYKPQPPDETVNDQLSNASAFMTGKPTSFSDTNLEAETAFNDASDTAELVSKKPKHDAISLSSNSSGNLNDAMDAIYGSSTDDTQGDSGDNQAGNYDKVVNKNVDGGFNNPGYETESKSSDNETRNPITPPFNTNDYDILASSQSVVQFGEDHDFIDPFGDPTPENDCDIFANSFVNRGFDDEVQLTESNKQETSDPKPTSRPNNYDILQKNTDVNDSQSHQDEIDDTNNKADHNTTTVTLLINDDDTNSSLQQDTPPQDIPAAPIEVNNNQVNDNQQHEDDDQHSDSNSTTSSSSCNSSVDFEEIFQAIYDENQSTQEN